MQIVKPLKKIIRNRLPGNAPDFLIIGAQKAGTTSLHAYLRQHPLLVGSKPKEIEFFSFDGHFNKGRDWYQSHFRTLRGLYRKVHYFESSPDYLYRSYVPKRIAEFKKDLKFIVILREPVSRAYSAWNMHREFFESKKPLPRLIEHGYINGKEHNSFRELLSGNTFPSFESCVESELHKINTQSILEEPSFIRKGFYIDQIERYFKYFEPNQFLFLASLDLSNNKEASLNKVIRFLGIPEFNWDLQSLGNKHQRNYTEKINPEIKKELELLYEPYNVRLFEKIGLVNW